MNHTYPEDPAFFSFLLKDNKSSIKWEERKVQMWAWVVCLGITREHPLPRLPALYGNHTLGCFFQGPRLLLAGFLTRLSHSFLLQGSPVGSSGFISPFFRLFSPSFFAGRKPTIYFLGHPCLQGLTFHPERLIKVFSRIEAISFSETDFGMNS